MTIDELKKKYQNTIISYAATALIGLAVLAGIMWVLSWILGR